MTDAPDIIADSRVPTPVYRQRRVVAPVIALLVYALLGFGVVPKLIPWQVTSRAESRLHREATLAAARFNPFTLEARLIGLDLRDRDDTPLLAFDTLIVNVSTGSILKWALVLDEFRVVRPLVVLRMAADGQPAVADLLTPDSTTAATDAAPVKLPRVLIHHLGIQAGMVRLVDQSRTPMLEEQFTDLGMTVDGLSTLPKTTGDHRLTVSFSSGAEIAWSGRNEFEPLRLEGDIAITGIVLSRLGEVFGATLPFRLSRGIGQAGIKYLVDRDPVGGLRLTVPSASVTLSDLAVQPDDRPEEWLRARQVEVQGAQLAWPARTASVALVRITEPWLAASRRQDGTLSWAPYLARLPGDSTGPAVVWNARVEAVEVVDGSATLTDDAVQPAFEVGLSKVTARVTPVTTDSTLPIAIEATAIAGAKATLSARGSATRSPMAASLDVAVSGLDLTLSRPYFGAAPPATVTAGTASAAGKVVYREGRPQIGFDGRAAIDGFALNDSTGAPLIAWTSMKVDGIHYTGGPDLLRIKSIRLARPFARVAISPERAVNLASLQRLLPPPDSAASTPTLPFEILAIEVVDGSIDFSDESLVLPFRTTIDSTRGAIRDVASFGGAAGSVELEGWIAPNGLARISGTLQAAEPYAATSVRMDIRNVLMSALTPYSAQFAGYTITQGRLDMDLTYTIENRQLRADHHIVATDLTLGDKVEGGEAPGFLVKLAISLLKDKDGKITLDVPVEGTVDDPEFSYRGIVWKAVKQILSKVATAPFRFLGNLLGISGDDLELVDFDPGRADVIPPEREKLDSLAAELGRRPELTLTVEGRYDSISDSKALREAKLLALIAARRDSLGRKAQADTSTTMLARILDEIYAATYSAPALDSLRTQFLRPDSASAGKPRLDQVGMYAAMRKQLVAAQVIEAGALPALGRDRGLAIQAALTASGTLDPTRVSVLPPAPVKQTKQGSSLVPSELGMDAK